MPAGSFCEAPGPGSIAVLAPVVLSKEAGLVVNGGSLKIVGSVTIGPDAAFAADLRKETSPVSILGSVTVKDAGAFYLGTETPYGPIFANIQGGVRGQNASAIVIQNTSIGPNVSVSGGGALNPIASKMGTQTNYTDFEDDQIKGAVTEVGYGGIWGGVIRSIIRGNLSFAYNSQKRIDEYDIGSDIIYGSAFCAGNNPPPNMGHSKGSPSIVHGPTFGDQAKTCTGVPGGGTGPPG